jgi:hypothetical protein
MIIKIAGLLAPLFKNMDISKASDIKEIKDVDVSKLDLTGFIEKLTELPEKDFNYIQDKCLQICSENLPVGLVKALNPNGTFGVIGLEDDTMTVMALTVHALVFNVTGFFGESPLASMIGGALTTFQQG